MKSSHGYGEFYVSKKQVIAALWTPKLLDVWLFALIAQQGWSNLSRVLVSAIKPFIIYHKIMSYNHYRQRICLRPSSSCWTSESCCSSACATNINRCIIPTSASHLRCQTTIANPNHSWIKTAWIWRQTELGCILGFMWGWYIHPNTLRPSWVGFGRRWSYARTSESAKRCHVRKWRYGYNARRYGCSVAIWQHKRRYVF